METKSDLSASNMDFKSSKSSLTSLPAKIKYQQSWCSKCFVVTFRTIYWIFYILIHLLFILFFVQTAYYPCTAIRDLGTYRSMSDMYTVRVSKHKPIALHMKCIGTGPETILYENGLAGKSNHKLFILTLQQLQVYILCNVTLGAVRVHSHTAIAKAISQVIAKL